MDFIVIEAPPATLARLLDEGAWPARIAEDSTADQARAIRRLAVAKAGRLRRLHEMPALPEWSTVRASEAPLTRQDLDEALQTMAWRMLGVAMVLFGLLTWLVVAVGAAQR